MTTKTTKKCSNNCTCSHTEAAVKPAHTYSFYSNVLNKPFSSVEELEKAEDIYFESIRAEEAMVKQQENDRDKLEEAFKLRNQARKSYTENLNMLTAKYQEDLKTLKESFESDKTRIKTALTDAEDAYIKVLKAFTEKYDTYDFMLEDDDTETSIRYRSNVQPKKNDTELEKLLNLLFF